MSIVFVGTDRKTGKTIQLRDRPLRLHLDDYDVPFMAEDNMVLVRDTTGTSFVAHLHGRTYTAVDPQTARLHSEESVAARIARAEEFMA